MSTRTRRKCRHCGQLFRPDPRNIRHQRGAGWPKRPTATTSTAPSTWPGCVPGAPPIQAMPARALLSARRYKNTHPRNLLIYMNNQMALSAPPLQDVFRAQTLVLTGLIAHLTGAALQEDIALTSLRLQQLALDIAAGDPDGRETIAVPAPPAPNPQPVQLTRPPLG